MGHGSTRAIIGSFASCLGVFGAASSCEDFLVHCVRLLRLIHRTLNHERLRRNPLLPRAGVVEEHRPQRREIEGHRPQRVVHAARVASEGEDAQRQQQVRQYLAQILLRLRGETFFLSGTLFLGTSPVQRWRLRRISSVPSLILSGHEISVVSVFQRRV